MPHSKKSGPEVTTPQGRSQDSTLADEAKAIVADPADVAAFLEPWQREVWLEHVLATWRAGWDACLDHWADAIGGSMYPAHPTELEEKRWGPGGREHFADPRPGDFRGRDAA